MQTIILGSGGPLPDPGEPVPRPWCAPSAGDLLFDCGRGVLMRPAAAGSAAGALRGALPDPSAQRSHHGPQRHRHLAMDHVVPTPSAPRLRPDRHGVAPGGDRGHAGARHRVPPGPSRRSAVAPNGRRWSSASAERCWRTGASASVPRPPIMPRSARPSASASRRAGGRCVIAGDTVPSAGAGRALRRRGHARAHGGAPRSDRGDRAAPAARRPRLPLLGGGRGPDRGTQRRRHPRADASGAGARAGHRARLGSRWPPRSSTGRWWWPTTC